MHRYFLHLLVIACEESFIFLVYVYLYDNCVYRYRFKFRIPSYFSLVIRRWVLHKHVNGPYLCYCLVHKKWMHVFLGLGTRQWHFLARFLKFTFPFLSHFSWTIFIRSANDKPIGYHFSYPNFVCSLTVLEGIALSSDPNYKVLSSSYPWIARKVLTDRSPKLRSTLRELVYKVSWTFHPLFKLCQACLLFCYFNITSIRKLY